MNETLDQDVDSGQAAVHQHRILVVDDEPNIRKGLVKGLRQEAGVVEAVGDVQAAEAKLCEETFQVVIADVRLPGDRSGLDLVTFIRDQCPDTSVIVITAHGTVETAVEAMRRGAFDFITKPVDLNLLRQQVRKALDHLRLRIENRELRDRLATAGELSGMIGNTTSMKTVFEQLRQVADTDATVFIQGESGTGKELVARALHDLSRRSAGPFVAVNLGAIPETLLESELFGHEKGAFTGAARNKPGCFEQANGGTLFLDEITEIPAKCQVDLLRVLESRQFVRVGGERVQTSNARVVSATNKTIQPLIDGGSFREDLFYRLNIVPIQVPALRERHEDIPLLADHFLNHFCRRHDRPAKTLSADAMHDLSRAAWPGNVRQLRNLMERLVVTSKSTQIERSDLPQDTVFPSDTPPQQVMTLADATAEAEKIAIQRALAACNCHREQAAKYLGISIRSLHYKMSRYGLH